MGQNVPGTKCPNKKGKNVPGTKLPKGGENETIITYMLCTM